MTTTNDQQPYTSSAAQIPNTQPATAPTISLNARIPCLRQRFSSATCCAWNIEIRMDKPATDISSVMSGSRYSRLSTGADNRTARNARTQNPAPIQNVSDIACCVMFLDCKVYWLTPPSENTVINVI